MGYPLTQSVIAQVGDLIFLQTSIADPGIYRNVITISAVMLIYTFVISINWLRVFQIKKINLLLLLPIIILIIFSISSFFNEGVEVKKRYSRNIFVSLFSPPMLIAQQLKEPYFKNLTLSPWKRDDGGSLLKPLNIVLVVGETLTENFSPDEKLLIFPNLTKLNKESRYYKNHHSSWPFSTKALY